jgi:hypothetical protein
MRGCKLLMGFLPTRQTLPFDTATEQGITERIPF